MTHDAHTPEQEAADEQLRAAVVNAHNAYFGDPHDTAPLVVVGTQGFTDDGDAHSGMGCMVSQPAPPLFVSLGLAHAAVGSIERRLFWKDT